VTKPPGGGESAARGSQRGALYAAEDQVARILDRSAEFPVVEVAGSHLTLPPERHFAELASVQRYVDQILALGWVQERWPGPASRPVLVRERRGASRAHYEPAGGVMALPLHRGGTAWALRELVVLHEIAHHLGSVTGSGPACDPVAPDGGAGRGTGAPTAGSPAGGAPTGGSPTDGARTDPPLRHEPDSPAEDPVIGHGPAFAGRFVELVDGVMGPEVGLLLRIALADQHIRPV